MVAYLKDNLPLLKAPGQFRLALRRRLQLYLLLFVVVIFSILVVFIVAFDLFSPHKAVDAMFALQLERYEHRLETYFNNTTAHGIHFSRQLAKNIDKILAERDASFEDVSDNQELIAALEDSTYELLYDTLRIADCSGSFIIFDATVNSKLPNAHSSRAGSYLKLTNVNTPKPVAPTMLWTRGVHEIGHNNEHIFHNKWQLEFDVSRIPFYKRLLKSASEDLVECYYYSPAFTLHGTWEKIMIFCVPIVGRNGQVYGICGFEINSTFFKLLHAEAGNRYNRISGLLAKKQGANILLDAGLEFGTKKGYIAGLGHGILAASALNGLNRYRLDYPHGGAPVEYVGVESEIILSPLSGWQAEEPWVIACMIPKEDYDYQVRLSYIKLAAFCFTFFTITLLLAYYISRRYNLPILRSINAIKEGLPHKTNITEIDDLLEFLANNDTGQSSVDMSAFYEFKKNLKKLSRAEASVFALYMEGYSAAKIAETLYVSINTIKSHNKNIYRKLNVSSRKELMVYAQMIKTSD